MRLFDRRVVIFISVLSATAWAGGSYVFFSRKEKNLQDRYAKGRAVVAKKYLRAGQPIEPGSLEEVSVPAAYIQPTAFEKISDVLDSTDHALYAARFGLLKGEQVTRSKVVEESSRWDLAWALEPKRLGLTLALDPESAGGGHLKPGDWVAVLAVLDSQDGISEPRADVIESRVQVSSVNGKLLGAAEERAEKSKLSNLSIDSFLVTLSLTPRQAARIFLARSRGRVALALRSAVDDESSLSVSVRLSDLRHLPEKP